MSPSASSPVKTILTVILVLLVVIGIWSAINWFNRSMANALNPLQQANNQLSTQVAELLHPTPTVIPDPVTIIHEVNALARLETIQYTIEKVITVEQGQDMLAPLFGDRLLFVAHGYVTAGIDMAKLGEADMWLTGDVLNVRLPEAEIFDATLDNEQSYVYDRETGLLTHGNPNLETLARQAAEQQILQAALDDGILEQARTNAELFLDRFFAALGYPNVLFVP
ncbi:MAG: DUF4230 domain-containing protein [Anaerolineales bacterium]